MIALFGQIMPQEFAELLQFTLTLVFVMYQPFIFRKELYIYSFWSVGLSNNVTQLSRCSMSKTAVLRQNPQHLFIGIPVSDFETIKKMFSSYYIWSNNDLICQVEYPRHFLFIETLPLYL